MLNLVGDLSSLQSCDQGTSAGTVVQRFNLSPHKSNLLVLQKNISKDYAIRNENITLVHFLLSSCDMSLHGKLVVVTLRRIGFKDLSF